MPSFEGANPPVCLELVTAVQADVFLGDVLRLVSLHARVVPMLEPLHGLDYDGDFSKQTHTE